MKKLQKMNKQPKTVFYIKNNKTEEIGIFITLVNVSKATGIPVNKLYEKFSRQKRLTITINEFSINKTTFNTFKQL